MHWTNNPVDRGEKFREEFLRELFACQVIDPLSGSTPFLGRWTIEDAADWLKDRIESFIQKFHSEFCESRLTEFEWTLTARRLARKVSGYSDTYFWGQPWTHTLGSKMESFSRNRSIRLKLHCGRLTADLMGV